MNAFERYAPYIREYIYKKGWTDLREVQVDACSAVLDTDANVIIASGTSSGKTEAAFFPMLTLLAQNPAASVGILYISPLKALINDQFNRLEELLEYAAIPVTAWHGDVSENRKRKLIRTNRGVLQITPESLEAMLMLRPDDVRFLFSDLRFIVIDEIHSFMGTDRGMQVQCQIDRIEKLCGICPRRIGLSATLQDYQAAKDYLGGGSSRDVTVIGVNTGRRSLQLAVDVFPTEEDLLPAETSYYRQIYQMVRTSKCLVFTNSRAKAEETIGTFREIAAARGDPNIFYVHHGSLSAALRQETERAMRGREEPTVTAATMTLELGIDIGDLDLTVQTAHPFSCSSFVQRIGRSGRKSGISRMYFASQMDEEENPVFGYLPMHLLISVAIIELYLQEHWIESEIRKKKPFSLLVHQTLSLLTQNNSMMPAELAKRVLRMPPFADIRPEEYRTLLRHLIAEDYVARMESGELIVGLAGEKLTNFFQFYGVFQEQEEIKVYAQNHEIGSLDRYYDVGDLVTLAGYTWRIVTVEYSAKRMYAERVAAKRTTKWKSDGAEIHDRVFEKIREILKSDRRYAYLRPAAAEALQKARGGVPVKKLIDADVIIESGHTVLLCPWCGSRLRKTIVQLLTVGLERELQILGVSSDSLTIRVRTGLYAETMLERLRTVTADPHDPGMVIRTTCPTTDKYDRLLPESLLRLSYLENEMTVNEALKVLHRMGEGKIVRADAGLT